MTSNSCAPANIGLSVIKVEIILRLGLKVGRSLLLQRRRRPNIACWYHESQRNVARCLSEHAAAGPSALTVTSALHTYCVRLNIAIMVERGWADEFAGPGPEASCFTRDWASDNSRNVQVLSRKWDLN
jgi:hypothetical protein